MHIFVAAMRVYMLLLQCENRCLLSGLPEKVSSEFRVPKGRGGFEMKKTFGIYQSV